MESRRSCLVGPCPASFWKQPRHRIFTPSWRRNNSRTRLLLHLFWLVVGLGLLVAIIVEAKPRKDPTTRIAEKRQADSDDDIPGVPFLIEVLGKKLFSLINRPKYRFYLYLTLGKLPDERTFVAILNLSCNFLYCTSILVGFLLLPRNYMLVGTLITLVVGPALILILVGTVGLLAVAFGLYPIPSVISLWLIFFLKSQLFQVLGRRLGLDADGDGDVDVLDLLHCASRTSWGRWIGLPKLHEALRQAKVQPFQEIKRRLDEILNQTESVRALVTEQSVTNTNGDTNKKIS